MKSEKHYGVLFQGEMVRAILEDRKTQTRRLRGLEHINAHPDDWEPFGMNGPLFRFAGAAGVLAELAPEWPVGTILYVKETFFDNVTEVVFRADGEFSDHFPEDHADGKWLPSIFMPKVLSRAWLRVTEVRCERLQDINDVEALAEGMESYEDNENMRFPHEQYMVLWNRINDVMDWIYNPWVWVYTFKRIERPPLA